ncbi:Putative NADH-dependent dehydrogenase [hydrothermal vent metagenome]|uniref:NADH-dependent dehydrogenase n=1 Tax=hydrothermal vent metagenome TaxID=652676 RepID=A0A3B1CUC3_9ZZZZ
MKNKFIDRRKFIKKLTGASLIITGFPYFVSAKTLGRDGGVSPNDKIIVACIGVGGMGDANMKSFLGKEEAKVVAICDVDKKHAKKAQSAVNRYYKNKDCAIYSDYRELLNRNDLDAVMIATPDHWHSIIAIAATKKGLDIYGEKPLAYNIPEGRALVNAVEKYGIIWQTGSWQRSERNFRFACELVRNGRIGDVHTVFVGLPGRNAVKEGTIPPAEPIPEELNYDMWLGPAAWLPYHQDRCHFKFRWNSNFSAGTISDWAAHHIDIAHWGMGVEDSSPIAVTGKAVYPDGKDGLYDNPLSYKYECEYAEGFKLIAATEGLPKGSGVQFVGTEGWVHVNRSGISAENPALLKSVIGPGEIHLYKSTNHVGNFLECVRSRKKTITPSEVAHHSIMPAYIASIAMQLGRKVRWDGKREQFINDEAANRLLSRTIRSPWRL